MAGQELTVCCTVGGKRQEARLALPIATLAALREGVQSHFPYLKSQAGHRRLPCTT